METNTIRIRYAPIILGAVISLVTSLATSILTYYFTEKGQEQRFIEERIRIINSRAYEEKKNAYFYFLHELNSTKMNFEPTPNFMASAQQLSLVGSGPTINAVNRLIYEMLSPKTECKKQEYILRIGQLETALLMAMRQDLGIEPDVSYEEYLKLFNLEGEDLLNDTDPKEEHKK